MADVLAALGLAELAPPATRENRSVGSLGVSMLRKINQRELSVADKAQAVQLVEALDRLVDGYSCPFTPSSVDIELINILSDPSLMALQQEYGIDILQKPSINYQ